MAVYEPHELAERDDDAYALTFSRDGMLVGRPITITPLRALLRGEVDVTVIEERLDNLADTVTGTSSSAPSEEAAAAA